jgi:hypothetical protein
MCFQLDDLCTLAISNDRQCRKHHREQKSIFLSLGRELKKREQLHYYQQLIHQSPILI